LQWNVDFLGWGGRDGSETHIINAISSDPVKALEENQESIHHSESSREVIPIRQLVVHYSEHEEFNVGKSKGSDKGREGDIPEYR